MGSTIVRHWVMIPGPAASATPRTLLEMQNIRLHPGPAQSVFILARFPGDSVHIKV